MNLDIHVVDLIGNNGLSLACKQNENIQIIKYLINDLHLNVYHKNYFNNSTLHLAISENKNIEVTKYLINDLQMNFNQTIILVRIAYKQQAIVQKYKFLNIF